MDNTDSEMIESLNILRPPVRRDYKTSRFGYNPNAINFMTEWRKPKKRIKGGKRIRRNVGSSTSLILKKTSEREVFHRYPVVSYTSIQQQPTSPSEVKLDEKEKPLIKVIVVPNDQPSEGKQPEKSKLNKPFFYPCEGDKTIETKNVYLVVTGGKKDKIYEIKTAESPTISTTELKDETVTKFFNGDCFKQLIKALNMERKKTNPIVTDDIDIDHICKCTGCTGPPCNIEEPTQEIDSGRNKVKIYGQLGLTEDDRYILKCSATVDDKPVPTTFSTVGQKAPDDLEDLQQMQTNFRPYKEANIQVNAIIPPHRNVSSQAKIGSLHANDYLSSGNQTSRESQRRQVECLIQTDIVHNRTQQTQRKLVGCFPGDDVPPLRNQESQCCKPIKCPPDNDPCRTQQSQCCKPIKCPPENDPCRTQQSQCCKPIKCPPENDPCRTQQSQCCKPIKCPPDNDMAPRRTQQSQRIPVEYPSENDMAPRRTQQSQRKPVEYSPENDMAPRRTQQSQRVPVEYPPENDMAPRRTQQSQRRPVEYPPENDMAPRRTQQSQRRPVEYPPESDMAPRTTQQSRRRSVEYPPENEMAPRRTQQSQRRPVEYPPENDMTPRRSQQAQQRMQESFSGNYQGADSTIPPPRPNQRKTYEPYCKTVPCPPKNPYECCGGGRDVQAPGEMHFSARRNSPTGSVMEARQYRQSSPRRTILEEPNTPNRYESQTTTQENFINNENNYSENNQAGKNFTENARKSRPYTKDNDTQAACTCGNKNISINKVTETQSPLVIISVYPNAEVECETGCVSKHVEANFYETSSVEFSRGKRRSRPKQDKPNNETSVAAALKDTVLQEDQGRRPFIHKTYRKPNRSPPPQNIKNKNGNDQNTVIETRMVRTNASSQSPSNIPYTNKNHVRSNTCRTIKKQESKKTTASKQKNTTATKNPRNTQISKNKSKPRSKDKYGNGNQMKSKAFVADKYKKAINERVDKYNRTSPKHNVSAVSVNIDSENEFYDVSYYQGKYTTDLLVRKTSKNWEKLNDSSVNFLPGSKKPMLAKFQTYSVSGTDNFPDNEQAETTSKLNPRDSLEISHRQNLRTEIETQTRIEHTNNVSKNDMRYFAPVKHFTGDNCVICDPLARDKEIQQLLGISRRVVSSQTTDVQKAIFGYKHFITQQYYSDERECKDVLCSNVEFVDSLCSCCCLRRSNCETINKRKRKHKKSSIKKAKQSLSFCKACEKHQIIQPMPLEIKLSCCSDTPKPEKKKEEKKKPCEKPVKPEPPKQAVSLYQQLILNRNIHIFLQVEEFCKQKPIILTKQQYDKVKKTIKKTLSKNKHGNKKTVEKCDDKEIESLISIGEVRQKANQSEQRHDEKSCGLKDTTPVQPTCEPVCVPVKSAQATNSSKGSKRSWRRRKDRSCNKKNNEEQVKTVILYSRDNETSEQTNIKIGARQTMSSIEVRYASVAYSKHITFSAADTFKPYFEPLPSESSLALKDPISIETLFKGHKKCPTPNLGTSTLTCMSEPSYLSSPKLFDKPNQAKRPFLKRLMSCLVMRSDKTPMPQLMPPKYAPTVDSSFDSYHFSTSLGAIEMSSSMYDTSASFFSNHSVYPKSNKIKRSFFNSMRGFLHNKRS